MIRQRLGFYLGDRPWAHVLIREMVGDLLVRRALPIAITSVGNWWKVSASNDWLLAGDGVVSMDVFERIVHFPEKGTNAIHSEVLVNAAAGAVVTVGSEGKTWISGSQFAHLMPAEIELDTKGNGWERILV